MNNYENVTFRKLLDNMSLKYHLSTIYIALLLLLLFDGAFILRNFMVTPMTSNNRKPMFSLLSLAMNESTFIMNLMLDNCLILKFNEIGVRRMSMDKYFITYDQVKVFVH